MNRGMYARRVYDCGNSAGQFQCKIHLRPLHDQKSEKYGERSSDYPPIPPIRDLEFFLVPLIFRHVGWIGRLACASLS